MRITSTTSAPVRANEITAAGPAAPMTTPLPTNRPAPITPPSAIICMCRRRSERRSPLDAGLGRVIDGGSRGNCTPAGSHEFLVFLEVPDRPGQGVTAEWITELLRLHHLQHRRLAGALRGGGRAQGRGDVRECISAVAKAHGGEHRPRPVETQIGVGDRADIADVR